MVEFLNHNVPKKRGVKLLNIPLQKCISPKRVVLLSIAIAIVCMGLFVSLTVAHSRYKIKQIDKRIAAVPVDSLREAGRYLILKRSDLALRGAEQDRMRWGNAVLLMHDSALYEKECPDAIKRLEPGGVFVYSDHVLIYISTSRGVVVFAEGVPGSGERKIGEGVWIQSRSR